MTMTDIAQPPVATRQVVPRAHQFGNETAKGLRLAWHRKGTVATGIVVGIILYLGISLFIGGGHVVEELMVLTLPALLAFIVAETAAMGGSGGIAEEVNGGTLEQTRLSPASVYLQVLARMAALAVEGLFAAAVAATLFILWFDLDYTWHVGALVPAALTVLNALGYGLLMTALTLRVASIGAIVHVFNMVLMIFGGMLVPVTSFPEGIQTIAHFVPISLGVESLNATLADGGLAASWADGMLPWLLVHTTALTAAGFATYALTMRRALQVGALSPQ